jgi:hypothetical protein
MSRPSPAERTPPLPPPPPVPPGNEAWGGWSATRCPLLTPSSPFSVSWIASRGPPELSGESCRATQAEPGVDKRPGGCEVLASPKFPPGDHVHISYRVNVDSLIRGPCASKQQAPIILAARCTPNPPIPFSPSHPSIQNGNDADITSGEAGSSGETDREGQEKQIWRRVVVGGGQRRARILPPPPPPIVHPNHGPGLPISQTILPRELWNLPPTQGGTRDWGWMAGGGVVRLYCC